MNRRSKCALTATIVAMVTFAYAGDSGTARDLSEVKLPENSCAITCPAGTKWRGQQAAGGAVSCRVGSAPVCQCHDDSKPIAGCEAIRESTK
jgi:hypothetical protein